MSIFCAGLLYSRLESKLVSIVSRLACNLCKTKFQLKTKTKLRKVFATSCRHFSLARFRQVMYIIKKQTRTKNVV